MTSVIDLEYESFPELGADPIMCAGWQIALVVESFEEVAGPHSWFGADILGMGADSYLLSLYQSENLKLVGSGSEVCRHLQQVSQLLSGVLWGARSSDISIVETADSCGCPDNLWPGIDVAIYAFDTSRIYCYFDDENLATRVSEELASRGVIGQLSRPQK